MLERRWGYGPGAPNGNVDVVAPAAGLTSRSEQSARSWPPGQEPPDSPLVAAIVEAARALNDLRESWLNPPPGSIGESELKKRTLTNLYNEGPTWLDLAHRKLDEAVFAAYGWPEAPGALSDQEILARLLAFNLERAGVGGGAASTPPV